MEGSDIRRLAVVHAEALRRAGTQTELCAKSTRLPHIGALHCHLRVCSRVVSFFGM